MSWVATMDWGSVLVPDTPVLRISVLTDDGERNDGAERSPVVS